MGYALALASVSHGRVVLSVTGVTEETHVQLGHNEFLRIRVSSRTKAHCYCHDGSHSRYLFLQLRQSVFMRERIIPNIAIEIASFPSG